MLLIKNYKDQIRNKLAGMKKARPLFTVNGSDAKKNQGWSKEGMREYNRLEVEVEKRRKKEAEKGNPLARRYREEKKNEKEERDQVKANKRQAAVDKREKEYDAPKDKSWEKKMMKKLGLPYIDPDESLRPATTQTGQTQMVQPTPV